MLESKFAAHGHCKVTALALQDTDKMIRFHVGLWGIQRRLLGHCNVTTLALQNTDKIRSNAASFLR